jgi:uncharacterized membrane protein
MSPGEYGARLWIQHNDPEKGFFSVPVTMTVLGLSLSTTTDERFGFPGETVTFTLRIGNDGSALDQVCLARAKTGWLTFFSPPCLDIAPGGQQIVSVIVQVPADAQDGDVDVATIAATGLGDRVQAVLRTTASNWPERTYLPWIEIDDVAR